MKQVERFVKSSQIWQPMCIMAYCKAVQGLFEAGHHRYLLMHSPLFFRVASSSEHLEASCRG